MLQITAYRWHEDLVVSITASAVANGQHVTTELTRSRYRPEQSIHGANTALLEVVKFATAYLHQAYGVDQE